MQGIIHIQIANTDVYKRGDARVICTSYNTDDDNIEIEITIES